MTTVTKNVSTNSFGFASPKTSTAQTTCNICRRLLYSFEEILLCRVCHGSYHWRCVKPETISHYGENENYICDKCSDGTKVSSPHRITNGDTIIKSTDSVGTNYRNFTNVPSKTNSPGTSVIKNIRYFEEKQQQSQAYEQTKGSKVDNHLPSQTNGNDYHHRNSHYSDDSKSTQRNQQQQEKQQNEIESDEEDDTTAMFQANYRYTPLKEYAAMRTTRTTNENNINVYQNSPSDNTDRPATSRYGGGLQYTNHGYDPTVSRLVEIPSSGITHFTSPTVDNLSIHNRQHHFISTTNLNINDTSSRRQQQQQQQQQQQSSLNNSTPYLSQIRDNNSPILKSLSQQQQQQQTDRHSTVGSDSGIVIVNPISQQHQQQHSDENQLVERKLTDLVQKLGKQLENDAQKVNEKLESKLKTFENMIHQQTFIIRQQDEVIERLKSKILKIETERDHFRERLSAHEQRENDEKKIFHEEDHQAIRKSSITSTTITDSNKPSIKKTPAPRVDQQWSTTNDEQKPSVAKLMRNLPIDHERTVSDSSSAPSMTSKPVSSVPLTEPSAASNRLDNIIHQSSSKDITNPITSTYSLAEVRRQDRSQAIEPISREQQQVITTIHHDNNDTNNEKNLVKPSRSHSLSSSSSSLSSQSSNSATPHAKTFHVTQSNDRTTTRNSSTHRSFESLQDTYKNDQSLKPTNKAASLEFGKRPVRYDDPASIYVTPREANYPAIQSNSNVKGWLRKQNRESFFKRIDRYYCILTEDALLMHRHEHDRTPQKAINLKGATVLYYDDAKFGPSLELTWSNRGNDPKHYHLYAPNPQEANQWVNGIRTIIQNLGSKNKWQRYRMNT